MRYLKEQDKAQIAEIDKLVKVFFSPMHDSVSSNLERSRSADDMTANHLSQHYLHYYSALHHQNPAGSRLGPVPHIETSPNLLHPRLRGNQSSPPSPSAPAPLLPLTPPLLSGKPRPHVTHPPGSRTAVDKYHLLGSSRGHFQPGPPGGSQSGNQLPAHSQVSQAPVQHSQGSQIRFYGGDNSDTPGSEGTSLHCSDNDPADDLSDTDEEEEWLDCDITQV
ncbi:hypothetical protein EGW08_015120 [Elysia chlorotica]|uniref:Uncharacterized protein n=1 Tax=Elysia chlorotica TaxID=188477 RepID=A0A3S1HDE8_ELYCH|nr:hypothetical protein EGW08_015120 [Elysia chlorotica]